MRKLLPLFLSVGTSLLLSSCAVYMPIQCAAPQIKGKNEVELTGSTYVNGRYEAAASYSPVRHLLVRAAYSSLPRSSNDSTYYHGYQYEVAAGTYWPLGSRWLLGGLAGFGQAHSEARYFNDGQLIFFGKRHQHVFDADYNKVFGEVYGSLQASNTISFGAAYRVTHVKFTSLSDVGVPLDLRSMTRSEPMFFFRVRPGSGVADTRPVQLQFAFGTSATFGYQNTAGSSNTAYQVQKPRGYITLGCTDN